MTPTQIETAHGRKLIADIQPSWMKNHKNELIYAYGLVTRYYDITELGYGCAECCNGDRCDEDCDVRYRGGRKNCPHCKGKGRIPKQDVIPTIYIGTLHHDGGWVSSFDVEPFVESVNNSTDNTLWYLHHQTDTYCIDGEEKTASIHSFISLLNSYGVGYLTNPLGEKPTHCYSDSPDWKTSKQYLSSEAYQAWLKAEEGVLKPDMQIVFIEQLNP